MHPKNPFKNFPAKRAGGSALDDPKTRARRKKGDDTMAPASDLVRALMRNVQSPLSSGFLRLQLETQWPQIVGPRMASLSKPAAYDDGVLEIWVAHPTWMQELWYIRDELKQKINRHVGLRDGREWCREVKFTLNSRQAGPTPNKPPYQSR